MPPIAMLPDLSEPSTVAFGAAIGAFLGSAVARLLRYDADNRSRLTIDGSFYGTGVALCAYLLINLASAG